MTQSDYIVNLLIELLADFDPTLDLAPGSTLYTEVIQPISDALAVDPLSSDAETFILARLKEEFPNLSIQSGDAVLDLLVRPMQILLEGYRRELEIIKRGQNLSNIGLLTLEQAEDLASNFFITRKEGNVSTGLIRIYFSNPTYVSIGPNTEFATTSGLIYYSSGTFHITPQKMLNQRSGRFYYIDIPIQASASGEQYNVEAGTITIVSGVNGAVRVSNLFGLTGGLAGENSQQLLTRAGMSLTERSLNTRRGIRAQILELFKGVKSLEVIGYGDPEMKRDILTGTSNGKLLASGISMVVGSFVVMISMFEDNGPLGTLYAKAGNKVDLNFTKILYDVPKKVQSFTIQEMIFSSEDSLTNLPTVYIFKLDKTPDVQTPTVSSGTSLIPGALPGVFSSIYGKTEIQISTGPDLIDSITTNEVAVGGKLDILVQPSTVSTVDSTITASRSLSADHESLSLSSSGSIPSSLTGKSKANIVASNYKLITPPGCPISAGSAIRGRTSNAYAVVAHKNGTGDTLILTTFSGVEFKAGETIEEVLNTSITSLVSEVSSDNLEQLGVKSRSCLHILSGTDIGQYKVLHVEGSFAYLTQNLSTSTYGVASRFISKTKISMFNPVSRKYPFPEGEATGLQTTIGLAAVEVQVDLQQLGILVGDSLEILEGSNKGVYTISTFGPQGGKFPVLSKIMQATQSNLSYIVYRESTGVESPLIRVLPGGVSISANRLPYSRPVGALALEGFSGSATAYFGVNGFVLPDPGDKWKPTSNTYARPFSNSEVAFMDSIGGGVTACYTAECEEEGEDLICTLTLVSDANNNVELYLEGAVTQAGQDYLQYLRDYFLDLVNKFELGIEFATFINLFGPVNLGAPPTSSTPLKHYEIKLPREMFDSYNNVFVAIPEFNWKTEFSKETTFSGALDKINNGTMVGKPPALYYSEPGDCFTIQDGPNAGSYRIAKISKIKLYLGSSVLTSNNNVTGIDDSKAYDLVIVTVEGEFPHKPAHKLSDFFADGITVPSLPAVPTINIQSIATVTDSVHTAGDVVSPFEVVQKSFTWLFQFLHSIGFDVDNTINIDAGPTLQKIVQKLFYKYFTGHQSCVQDVRLMFQDPCEIIFKGSRTSKYIEWFSENQLQASVTTNTLSLPLSNVSSITVLLKETLASPVIELTATNFPGLSSESNLVDAASILQSALDPDSEHITIAGVSGPRIRFSAVKGGEGSSIQVSTNSGGGLFSSDTLFDAGSSQNSSTKSSTLTAPINPTIVISTAAEQTLEFASKLTKDDYIPIYPTEDAGFSSLERDILLSSAYSGSTVSTATSQEDADSWFKSGVQLGDEVFLYEQKFTLDHSSIIQNNMYKKIDRVSLISTTKSSTEVTLLGSPSYHFRSPESGDASDFVEVGDILSIESGPSKGMYSIVEVSQYSLKLDSSMKSNVLGSIVKSGSSGSISAGSKTLLAAAGSFSSDDVGKFLTIYASSFSNTDGSFQITSVGSSGADVVLDTSENFEYDATDLLWAVTSNNLETPSASEVEGRTSTLAGFPFRIYSGTPKRMPVVKMSKDLKRTAENLTLYYGDHGAPKVGKSQPYRIVRTHHKKVSADQMSAQNYLGLFYADCTFTAITPDLVSNIPSYTSLVPKISSLDTRGYQIETTDENLSFSNKEEAFFIADAVWQPIGATSDYIAEFNNISLTIDLAIETSAVQGYVDSRDNRVLCSDPLVKSFCPSYVYFTVTSSGGTNALQAAEMIKEHIENLQPEDPLIVSEFEKFLHQNGISNYEHPLFIVTLTHDLDRKIVMTINQDRISDSTLNTKVTNRTTFYLSGAARTSGRSDGIEIIAVKGGL